MTQPKAIVVGGGPIGLAAALTLAHDHGYDVCVFESDTRSRGIFDPGSAYMYNVNRRGQAWTMSYPSVQRKLEDRGVVMSFGTGFVTVPADPRQPIPRDRTVNVAISPKTREEAGRGGGGRRRGADAYWIPRHEMVELLGEAIDEYNENPSGGTIEVRLGEACVAVRPHGSPGPDELVRVVVEDASTGRLSSHDATVIVGADGMNSKVRQCLADGEKEFSSWDIDHTQFVVKKWVSPATGLRLKVLQLPPQFEIPDSDGTSLKTTSEIAYVLRSIHTGPTTFMSLGCLPFNNNKVTRPANSATRPNHQLWTLRTGEDARKWFESAFPRLPFHKDGGLVSEREWDRYAKAEGTRFPPCQYSPGMQVASRDGSCGVVLVGDALHAFPPDIGQGINAGLSDVVALGEAMKAAREQGRSLGSALQAYEHERRPEVKALIRLARFGAPYQYKQPLYADRVGRYLWTANVLLRLALNKASFGFIPQAAIMMSQNHELTFRQVMLRADLCTAGLVGAIALCLFSTARHYFCLRTGARRSDLQISLL